MLRKEREGKRRTDAQIREQYLIEKELAMKLRTATKQERQHLYATSYDELLIRVSHHPQLTRKHNSQARARSVFHQMQFLQPYLTPDTVFLELGPGDLSLSITVARQVKQVYAIDVSSEITKRVRLPSNCKLIISNGCDIPLPEESITLAYSRDLMEHLHPDDAFDQLKAIYTVLQEQGQYICITPNRLSGPNDISRPFDPVATGLHLKEYTLGELKHLFSQVGFSRYRIYSGGRGIYLPSSYTLITSGESLLDRMPDRVRKLIAGLAPVRALLGIILVGTKIS